MSMRNRLIVLFFIVFAFNLQAQKKLVKGFEALKIYNYFEARRLFNDELVKSKITFTPHTLSKKKAVKNPQYLAAAAYGLSTIYAGTDNPFSNLDTAYLYARLADSLYFLATPAQQIKLRDKLLPVDSVTIDSLFSRIYARGFKEANKMHTVDAYESYIMHFPQSGYVLQAQQNIEDIEWEQTQKDNTFQAYKIFIGKYPYSPRLANAKAAYELRLYQALTNMHTVDVYRNFAQNYPDSPYALQAQDSVYALATRRGAVTDFYSFIKQNPENRNVDKAWDRLYIVYNADGKEETLKRFGEEYPDYPGADRLGRDLQLAGTIMLPFDDNGKWGFIDTTGKILVAPQYEWAGIFSDGLAAVGLMVKRLT